MSSWLPTQRQGRERSRSKAHEHGSGSEDEQDEESALLSRESSALLSKSDRGWDGHDDDTNLWADDGEPGGRQPVPSQRRRRNPQHLSNELEAREDEFELPKHLRWLQRLQAGKPREKSRFAALDLFRYRSHTDELLMIIAGVLSAVNGIMMPMSCTLFGSLVHQLNQPAGAHKTSEVHTEHAFVHPGEADWTQWKAAAASSVDVSDPHLFLRWSRNVLSFLAFYAIIGGLAMLTGYAEVGLWMIVSERQRQLGGTRPRPCWGSAPHLPPRTICRLGARLRTSAPPRQLERSPWLRQLGPGRLNDERRFPRFASGRQLHRVRVLYLHAILRQEMAWFDENKPSELASQMTLNTAMMQQGMGEKIGYLIHFSCTFVTGLFVGAKYSAVRLDLRATPPASRAREACSAPPACSPRARADAAAVAPSPPPSPPRPPGAGAHRHDALPLAGAGLPAGLKWPPPCLTTPPHLPPWTV